MSLITEHEGPADEYDAVALPAGPELSDRLPAAIFRRRSPRPSRRAVLHLRDLSAEFAPADLARWYNERGFHFYVTDLAGQEALDGRVRGRSARAAFAALDMACRHLRETDGIDAIILSAQDAAASAAAQWCDARRTEHPVDALILTSPDFGRAGRTSLDIDCPVLIIAVDQVAQARQRRSRRGADAVRLGQHVTWLHLTPADVAAGDLAGGRRRLFDEMGRWLGAYMYGQVRDRLL